MKKLYIVLTNTGTFVSNVIRKYTGDEYNHVSIALKRDLSELYSFGRRNAYVFWYGGFVVEGVDHGTFKRFHKTVAKVYEMVVEDEAYAKAEEMISEFIVNRKKYHYNHLGILRARKNVDYQRNERCFYCSQFVRAVLVSSGAVTKESVSDMLAPGKLSELPGLTLIYEGLLREYEPPQE